MRVLKNRWFCRFASKADILDEVLMGVVKQIENNDCDANLGGGVFKQRLARYKEGKSSGYRIIVCLKSGTYAFFVYAFSKSAQENITPTELNEFKKLAKYLFALTKEQIDLLIQDGTFDEIHNEEKI